MARIALGILLLLTPSCAIYRFYDADGNVCMSFWSPRDIGRLEVDIEKPGCVTIRATGGDVTTTPYEDAAANIAEAAAEIVKKKLPN